MQVETLDQSILGLSEESQNTDSLLQTVRNTVYIFVLYRATISNSASVTCRRSYPEGILSATFNIETDDRHGRAGEIYDNGVTSHCLKYLIE